MEPSVVSKFLPPVLETPLCPSRRDRTLDTLFGRPLMTMSPGTLTARMILKIAMFAATGVITALAPSATALAQCSVDFTWSPTTIYQGTTVSFNATGATSGTAFNFNDGNLPSGWVVGGGYTVGAESCAQAYTNWNGTNFYWASTAGSGTPYIETSGVDVSGGGDIEFIMAYSIQGGSSPCEGPDAYGEGIYLEYSTNGGSTWSQVNYWDPNGGSAGSKYLRWNLDNRDPVDPGRRSIHQHQVPLDPEAVVGFVL